MRETYITFRQAMRVPSTNPDIEQYVRSPIAQRIKDKGESKLEVFDQTPPARHYAFFHHWAWWRNRWWTPDQRQQYQATMHLRLENRLKVPALTAGAFLGYLNPQSKYMIQGEASEKYHLRILQEYNLRSSKNHLRILQECALREINKQLNLWFWQRWWGIGMPQADLQSIKGYWLRLRAILALPLDDLIRYEAAFLQHSQTGFQHRNPMLTPPAPAYRVSTGSMPATTDARSILAPKSKEAELRLEDYWSQERQDKIVDRLRRGETLPCEESLLAELYGIDLTALLGKGVEHEAAILKQIRNQKRTLWRLAHPNSAAAGTLAEGPATQLRTWLTNESIQKLNTSVRLHLTSTIRPTLRPGRYSR